MYINLTDHHKTCLIKIVAAEVPWVDTMLQCSTAPQSMSNNITGISVDGAGDLAPEGGVATQSRIPGGEYLVLVITLI